MLIETGYDDDGWTTGRGTCDEKLVFETQLTVPSENEFRLNFENTFNTLERTSMPRGLSDAFIFGDDGEPFDEDHFAEEKDRFFYDSSQDRFRCGRVTTGVSYNIMSGKPNEQCLENLNQTTETMGKLEETRALDFDKIYEAQMPSFFEYGDKLPEVDGVWTLSFDETSMQKISTFEIQAAICASLNSNHHLMMCIGVEEDDRVTGCELSAQNRVAFRMAMTRAVAGEFQPPLIDKVTPDKLHGITTIKRDVSEITSMVDVLFVPVFSKQNEKNEQPVDPASENDEVVKRRYLVVIRVKECTDKLYQLSSGRIYVEENGQAVELSCLDEAVRLLVVDKSSTNDETDRMLSGSFFFDSYVPQNQMKKKIVNGEDANNRKAVRNFRNRLRRVLGCGFIADVILKNAALVLLGSSLSLGVVYIIRKVL